MFIFSIHNTVQHLPTIFFGDCDLEITNSTVYIVILHNKRITIIMYKQYKIISIFSSSIHSVQSHSTSTSSSTSNKSLQKHYKIKYDAIVIECCLII